jgi:hypothetical protein
MRYTICFITYNNHFNVKNENTYNIIRKIFGKYINM